MDTSKTYIKMCIALPIEMQPPTHTNRTNGIHKVEDMVWFVKDGKEYILYRQDQLQEMVCVSPVSPIMATGIFMSYFDKPLKYNILKDAASMEEAWLRVVMKEKCGKIWNGEEWIE
jgi:hypothetical protein